jgi:Raf kinase inhibitor-like YbhB/YbcL family protein
MSLTLQTTAFANGQAIPVRFTGDGADVSPELTWTEPPAGTKELAMIIDDPDAPTPEPWVHWVIYKLPADVRSLAEGIPTKPALDRPSGAVQGKNSWGTVGYRGPAPPKGHGTHHYHFRLYALDAQLHDAAGLDKNALLKQMKGHILAQAELVGTYQR